MQEEVKFQKLALFVILELNVTHWAFNVCSVATELGPEPKQLIDNVKDIYKLFNIKVQLKVTHRRG